MVEELRKITSTHFMKGLLAKNVQLNFFLINDVVKFGQFKCFNHHERKKGSNGDLTDGGSRKRILPQGPRWTGRWRNAAVVVLACPSVLQELAQEGALGPELGRQGRQHRQRGLVQVQDHAG